MTLIHDTIEVRRTFDVPLERVFEAWKDSAALARWCCPGDDGWSGQVEAHDFKLGGVKRISFGPAGEEPYVEESHYLDIVPGAHIVNSERISKGQVLISTSLVTLEFLANGGACDFSVTDQITFFNAQDNSEERRRGLAEVLGKLGRYLEGP